MGELNQEFVPSRTRPVRIRIEYFACYVGGRQRQDDDRGQIVDMDQIADSIAKCPEITQPS